MFYVFVLLSESGPNSPVMSHKRNIDTKTGILSVGLSGFGEFRKEMGVQQ
jgi:hypothetical protein